MIFARIGHGSCYYHWNEIFAGVSSMGYRKCTFVINEICSKTFAKIEPSRCGLMHTFAFKKVHFFAISCTKAVQMYLNGNFINQ